MKMRSLVVFLKLLLLAGLVISQDVVLSQIKSFGYIFTYPQAMTSGGKAEACLTLNNVELPLKLTVRFKTSKCGDNGQDKCENTYTIEQEHQCVELTVPKRTQVNQYRPEQDSLQIELDLKGYKITKDGPQDVSIFDTKDLLLAETDRGRYKPEDLVRIRILALEHDMVPSEGYTISKVTLSNPQKNKVKVWENVPTTSGLAQLEYQLQDSAPTGNWKLDVDGKISTNFQVEPYVLPRFKTTLEHPPSFYIDDKTVDIKVCAKYSYGRNVNGMGVIKVKRSNYIDRDVAPISKSEELKNGCVTLELLVNDLGLNRSLNYRFEITGSVVEQGTEETQSEQGYMYMTTEPYRITFDSSRNKIKPGLPYEGSVKITDRKVNLNGKKAMLCYRFQDDWTDWRAIATLGGCKDVLIGDKETIPFTIPPLKRISKGQIIVGIHVSDDNDKFRQYNPSIYLQPSYSASIYLKSSYSDSSNSLQIIPDSKQETRHCGDDVSFTVLYTLNNVAADEIVFNYLLVSRYDVVKTGHVDVKPKRQLFDASKYENVLQGDTTLTQSNVPIDEFKFNLKLDGEIFTNAKLVVFYMTNGEVIADEVNLNIERCLRNKVDIEWNKDTFEPAEKASLEISTGKGSLCALTGIDKASTFQSPPDAFTVDKILRPSEFGRRPYYYPLRSECIMPKEEVKTDLGGVWLTQLLTSDQLMSSVVDPYYRRPIWRPTSLEDAMSVFRDISIGVISNQKLITKPCERQVYFNSPWVGVEDILTGSVQRKDVLEMLANSVTAAPDVEIDLLPSEQIFNTDISSSTPARTYFPETFLWDLVPAENGHAWFESTLPDSITNWVTKALCVSKTKGVGLSSSLELNVFKPFFVDVLMPYSIKRNTEIMHLPVAVFNYLNHSIPVRVTLGDNEDLELVDGGDKKTASFCVEADDSATHIYRIKALKLGTLNVSVSAELDPDGSTSCGNQEVVVKRDLVYKTVKVEAEGYPSDIVKSALLCADGSMGTDHVSWEINLPEDVVIDTVIGSITINSDILGPVIENLDTWLRVPTGCGEQTMAGLVPNLYVLRYLKSNNALTKEIEAKALKNMETGYQRILGYSHEDGSFSAFGKSDKNGSMFLTAFVVRTLRLMKEYMTINDDVINKAVGWMMEHQNVNGCFDSVSHIFHRMGADGENVNQTTALTSYVVISFSETELKVSDEVLTKAKECILRGDKSDNYTMAISSYAFGLLGMSELADANLKLLIEAADVENDQLFWKQKGSGWNSGARNVEVAGYALLALLQRGTPEYIGYAASIVRFLQTQMNPQGGYHSTQDSVVALDGMSRFANVVNKKELNLDIEISTKQNGKYNLQITKRDQNTKEEIPLVTYPELIDINVKGSGCVLGQAVVKFNVNEKPKSEALKLTVSTKSATKKQQCSLLEVTPCVSYNANGHSNMALLEVTMPSGYIPDQASLYALLGSVPEVKKFELIEDRVVLYFDRLTSTEICTPFVIQESVVVENKVDPTVKLYDYYTPDVSVSQSFKLPTCETASAIGN